MLVRDLTEGREKRTYNSSQAIVQPRRIASAFRDGLLGRQQRNSSHLLRCSISGSMLGMKCSLFSNAVHEQLFNTLDVRLPSRQVQKTLRVSITMRPSSICRTRLQEALQARYG